MMRSTSKGAVELHKGSCKRHLRLYPYRALSSLRSFNEAHLWHKEGEAPNSYRRRGFRTINDSRGYVSMHLGKSSESMQPVKMRESSDYLTIVQARRQDTKAGRAINEAQRCY